MSKDLESMAESLEPGVNIQTRMMATVMDELLELKKRVGNLERSLNAVSKRTVGLTVIGAHDDN